VAFGLEDADLLEREQAERALGAAVVLHVAVLVALEPQLRYSRRRDRELGDSAGRDADLDDVGMRH
jgi:hypothetical protein